MFLWLKTGESDATTSVKEASAHVCRERRRLVANQTAAMDRQFEKAIFLLESGGLLSPLSC